MFKLLRYFSLCSAIAMLIITVLLAQVYRTTQLANMVREAETQNLSLSRAISNTIGDAIVSYVQQMRGVDSALLRKSKETGLWHDSFRRLVRELPLLKVKFYAVDGTVIYSSEPAQIGSRPRRVKPVLDVAATGKPISNYELRPSFVSFDGVLANRDVVASYVPVRDRDGNIRAVLEVYTDVTAYSAAIGEHIGWVAGMLVLAFAALYFALYFIVRRADMVLARQYTELAEFNEKLEARVTERTRAAEDAALQLKSANKALEDATKAKSLFLANMSHEIRTPMNGVFGMTDLLMRTDLTDHQHRLVSTISQSARALLTVINDILDISRIEAGKLEVDRHEFDLRHCVEGAVDLFVDPAAKKGLALSMFVSSDAPAVVWGDKGRLRQICINLIGNAIKFTESGEVSVRVTSRQSRIGSTRLEFEVRDTGMGIDPAVIEKLLAPFTQADSSVSRRFGGTGLGLSISRHLVELMGGKLDIKSAPGRGTTIMFTLALEIGDSRKASRLVGRELPRATRVMVLDERASSRDIIASYLTAAGADVLEADSAVAGLEMLRREADAGRPVSVAVVDAAMTARGEIDPFEAIAGDERLAGLKTVLVAAINISGNGAEALRTGAQAVVSKPVREVDLITTVSRAMGRTPLLSASIVRRPVAHAATGVRFDARVLLAEDNPVNIEVAREFLGLLGCEVEVAENGRQAVAAFENSGPFDVILMDCQMPEMDGITATGLIRQRERSQKSPRVPIIAVTANAYDEDRDRCLDADMDDYLSKPFSEVQLVEVLRKWLKVSTKDASSTAAMDTDRAAMDASLAVERHRGSHETIATAEEHATPAVAMSPSSDDDAAAKREDNKRSSRKHGRHRRHSSHQPSDRSSSSAAALGTSQPTAAAPVSAPVAPDPVAARLPAAPDRPSAPVVPGPQSSRPGFRERLMQAMLQHAPKALAGLDGALAARDCVAIAMHAHSLKSSTANLEEQHLSELCRQLEIAAKDMDIEACGPLVHEIEYRVVSLIETYQQKLSAQTNVA